MSHSLRVGIVLALAVAVIAVLLHDRAEKSATEARDSRADRSSVAKQPRLVDLGAGKCVPCKMMAPILEQLKVEYAGSFEVVFIDVWKNPDAAEDYGVKIIPTQIFYDSSGKELFRHEGFLSKADILAKWKELGVNPAPSGDRGATAGGRDV